MQNKPLLLAVLAVLVLAKFVLLPLSEWQQQQLSELALLHNKLEKTKRLVLSKEELAAAFSAVEKPYKTLAEKVPQTSDKQKYRLEFQQQLESLLATHRVQVVSFAWQGDKPVAGADISEARIELRLRGMPADYVSAIADLQQQMPLFKTEDVYYTFTGSVAPTVQLDSRATFRLYFRESGHAG
jgi:hypothetical protein